MKSKKGFTLVELLAVILILAMIMVIGVKAVMPIIVESKKKTLTAEGLSLLKTAKMAHEKEIGNDTTLMLTDKSSYCFSLAWLKEHNYYDKEDNNYDGAVLVKYNAETKGYDYKFWIKNDEFFIENGTSDNYEVQEGVPNLEDFTNCEGETKTVCEDNTKATLTEEECKIVADFIHISGSYSYYCADNKLYYTKDERTLIEKTYKLGDIIMFYYDNSFTDYDGYFSYNSGYAQFNFINLGESRTITMNFDELNRGYVWGYSYDSHNLYPDDYTHKIELVIPYGFSSFGYEDWGSGEKSKVNFTLCSGSEYDDNDEYSVLPEQTRFDDYAVVYSDPYYNFNFELNDDGYYESQNKGQSFPYNNSYAYIDVNNTSSSPKYLKIKYSQYGEANRAYSIFSYLDVALYHDYYNRCVYDDSINDDAAYELARQCKLNLKNIPNVTDDYLIYEIPQGRHYITLKYLFYNPTNADVKENGYLKFKIDYYGDTYPN